jgi:hypothetical protein
MSASWEDDMNQIDDPLNITTEAIDLGLEVPFDTVHTNQDTVSDNLYDPSLIALDNYNAHVPIDGNDATTNDFVNEHQPIETYENRHNSLEFQTSSVWPLHQQYFPQRLPLNTQLMFQGQPNNFVTVNENSRPVSIQPSNSVRRNTQRSQIGFGPAAHVTLPTMNYPLDPDLAHAVTAPYYLGLPQGLGLSQQPAPLMSSGITTEPDNPTYSRQPRPAPIAQTYNPEWSLIGSAAQTQQESEWAPNSYDGEPTSDQDECSINSLSSIESKRRDKYATEKPKKDEKRSWIRTNNATKGSTRTAKINNYDPEKVYKPAVVLRDWMARQSKVKFRYNKDGELYNQFYTAGEIAAFLYEYPNKNQLRLWIQRSPADSARRYPNPYSSKCRFRECPVRRHLAGTITHGHYRVAFDEQWERARNDRKKPDPFIVSGYVHLYCIERFLDFPDICRRFRVDVDRREFSSEPKGHFAAGFQGADEGDVGVSFINACRHNRLGSRFPGYPKHSDYEIGDPKPHKRTLTWRMHRAKEDARPPAQRHQLEKRGTRNTHVTVHLGDLEIYAEAMHENLTTNREKRKVEKNSQ